MEMDNLLIHTGCSLERVLVSCYGKPQAFWLMLIKKVPCEGYSAALLWEVREIASAVLSRIFRLCVPSRCRPAVPWEAQRHVGIGGGAVHHALWPVPLL